MRPSVSEQDAFGLIYHSFFRYGWLNHFRPKPLLPSHVYRFDPLKGDVRVVADGIEKPNGIAFSTDGKVAYMCVHLLCPIRTDEALTDTS